MRTFVALELPLEFIAPLHQVLIRLQDRYPDFRWSREENHHITLAFLGELDEKGVTLLKEAIKETLQDLEPFSIHAGKIITLPPGRAVKVLALDIEKGKKEMRSLAACFEKKLAARGTQEGYSFRKPEIRPYTPHITLARQGRTFITLSEDDRNCAICAQGVIRNVTVFRSDLYREGPRYTPLAMFTLGTSKRSSLPPLV
ncbi:MAG: RNA 2',3'-cyclic phosphodiesterase [Spirochaetaceae bacterium]|jgi:2'-5' RNA ligase|nr:RNA 2',3'-cyclic phosphodiesterase [Spirochaetaceae bacterium]